MSWLHNGLTCIVYFYVLFLFLIFLNMPYFWYYVVYIYTQLYPTIWSTKLDPHPYKLHVCVCCFLRLLIQPEWGWTSWVNCLVQKGKTEALCWALLDPLGSFLLGELGLIAHHVGVHGLVSLTCDNTHEVHELRTLVIFNRKPLIPAEFSC